MFCGYDFLTKEQNILLTLVRCSLLGEKNEAFSEPVDFSALWKEAEIQTVLLLALNNSESTLFSQSEREFLKNRLQSYFLKNIAVGSEHSHLHKLLTQAEIPYVIIKGMASSSYYPDELMRLMGDVDFLVKKEDMTKVDCILVDDGYTVRKKENSHHVTYDKGGQRIEMHFLPPGIPEGGAGERLVGFFDDITQKSSLKETAFGKLSVPSPYHHGLVLLLHTVHHMTGDGLGLRHLCDWSVFASSFAENDFRSIFEESLKSVGLWNFAVVLTRVCCECLGCSLVLSGESVCDESCRQFLADVFSSGNFGQKNPDRSHESLFMPDNNPGNKKNSLIVNAILSVNEIVYSNWRIVRKLKILLPVGWLFFGGRYIIRSLMGKRPEIRLRNVVSEARERQSFYDKLKLFEEIN